MSDEDAAVVYKQQYKEDNEGMYQAIENYILDLKSEQG